MKRAGDDIMPKKMILVSSYGNNEKNQTMV
jgi:hypothetical protein